MQPEAEKPRAVEPPSPAGRVPTQPVTRRTLEAATRRQGRWDAWIPRLGPGRSSDRAPGWVAASTGWSGSGLRRAPSRPSREPGASTSRSAAPRANLSGAIALAGILLVGWLLALVSGRTLGGAAHALPVLALFVALMHAARRRR